MRRIALNVCLGLAAFSLSSCTTTPQIVTEHQTTSLRSDLQELVDKSLLPGAIVIIERNGETIEQALVGWQDVEFSRPLQEDSIFRLMSMSKPITSVAIMMLAEQGRLSLDDPASKYLPEFRDMRVYVSGGLEDMVTEPVDRPITIRDLLTHNSGITYHFAGNTPVHQYYRQNGVLRDTPVGRTSVDGPPARSLDELVQRIGNAPLLGQPGAGFNYSYSTTVLGAIVERVTGKTLDVALAEMLFEPLGMTDTGFFISDKQLPRFTTQYTAVPDGIEPIDRPEHSDYRDRSRLLDGGGALVGTAADYLRFARMLTNRGELDGQRYLSEASVDEMFTPQVRTTRGLGFGYGFSIGDAGSEGAGLQPTGTASWSGSGNAYFLINPDTGLVALLMTHEQTPGESAARMWVFRRLLNRAVIEAEQ